MLRAKSVAIICLLIPVTLVPTHSVAQEEVTYRFERMWPTLQQPWYFALPVGVAVDRSGSVFVADTGNARIQKFTSDGQFMMKWGSYGGEPGEFDRPCSVAVDGVGSVYVVDKGNDRVQKFTSDGQFVTAWGSHGTNPGQFNLPHGIAVDGVGSVYIGDLGNHRIQKFTSDGQFVTAWGSYGDEPGRFDSPGGITVDGRGSVYVVDTGNVRIQKFTSDGQFIVEWDLLVGFDVPYGIALDGMGSVYVTDIYTTDDDISYRIQKFTSDGQFVMAWGSHGSQPGEFSLLADVAVDDTGSVYVADALNDRLQKFTSDGRFITEWRSNGSEPGEFDEPSGVTVDGMGSVYVADTGNHRIQKYAPDGQFVTEWGSHGSAPGEFRYPEGIAVDDTGSVYVADTRNERIQRFTSDGQFVTEWGSYGSAPGEFRWPSDVAVDGMGSVYVVEMDNCRIQKFSPDGQFVTEWGSEGSAPGEFLYPEGIAVDDTGSVYVTDAWNTRIQEFTSEGLFVTAWGSHGSEPGELNVPGGIAVDGTGSVYVADTNNHRIQKFTPAAVDIGNKAIIVAGGGPFPGNNLWDATQMCANFAYRTLTYQGFTKDTIYYLSSDLDLDLDSNGELDDVDGDAINANLHQAITEWAADADSLIVYLTDHGGNGAFRMSGSETLSSADLDTWLDEVQDIIPGRVTVIYDACDSGSFASTLTPPPSKDRIVITSTAADQPAHFLSQGSVSFSSFFWTEVFNGLDVHDAFTFARDALGEAIETQHPQLDANGNGQTNEAEDFTLVEDMFIGNGTDLYEDRPIIGSVSEPRTIEDTNIATLEAFNVSDEDGIARVWAIIRPPEYRQEESDNPILHIPSIELWPVGDDTFEGTYDGFSTVGTYHVAIYAKDRIGNTSLPSLTTVSVTSPLRRRAVLVAGGPETDPLWPAVETNVMLAYETLRFQGYSDDDIYFMSPVTMSAGVDGTPVLSNIEYTLTTWAAGSTQDLMLYLVGNGDNGGFVLNETERLSATAIDTWIDELQTQISGTVVVIYDACQSGSFMPVLTPPEGTDRIVLSSTGPDEAASFLLDGNISFSAFFWRRVLNGADVRNAFRHASNVMRFVYDGPTPQMDDDGDGIYDTAMDGRLAMNYTLGTGIMLAGDDPLIGDVSPEQTLTDGSVSGTLWVEDVTTTGTIDKVWAVISPPSSETPDPSEPLLDLPTLELSHVGDGRYEGVYEEFSRQGTYHIAVYAIDDEGNLSMPKETVVNQLADIDIPDEYEDNDSYDTASWIAVDGPTQTHNFHDNSDEDWTRFYARENDWITIDTLNLGPDADTLVELFHDDGTTKIMEDDNSGEQPLSSTMIWEVDTTGFYLIRVTNVGPTPFGPETPYDLRVWREIGPEAPGAIMGIVTDSDTGSPITAAHVMLTEFGSRYGTTDRTGTYLIQLLPARTYSMTTSAPGYASGTESVELLAGGLANVDFQLEAVDMCDPDVNMDGSVDAIDIQLVINEALGLTTGYCCDLNLDSHVDAVDIQLVINTVLGI